MPKHSPIPYPTAKVRKLFPPLASTLLIGAISAGICLLSLYGRLSAGLLVVLVAFQTFGIAFSQFREFGPPPALHLLRGPQGLLVAAPYVAAVAFLFSYVGGGMTAAALATAQQSVLSAYAMLLWALMAAVSLAGAYFAYLAVARWFPHFVSVASTVNTPFILYIIAALAGLMGLGLWTTFLHAEYATIFQRQDFGPKSGAFRRAGLLAALASLAISALLIVVEPEIWGWAAQIAV